MIVGVTPFASVYHSETIDNIQHMKLDLEREEFAFYSPMVKDLISQLLKRNPKHRMSCEDAKRHLWFLSNLSGTSLLKSAGYHKGREKEVEKKELMTFLLNRKESLKEGSHFPRE
jgi:serine/threonine protein kinase